MSTDMKGDSTASGVITKATDNGLAHYDEIEKELGISEFMSPDTAGFSAVMKARYSDFLVHEVALDGTIARLTRREIPKSMNDTDQTVVKENEAEKVVDDKPGQDMALEEDQWKSLQKELAEAIKDEGCATNVITMLRNHSEKKACNDKFVTLPSLEKDQRKTVHEWVRNSLKCARSDTSDGKIRIWHVSFEKEMANYNTFGNNKKRGNNGGQNGPNKRSKKSWPEGRPDFLRFVLYKENIDTTTATKELSRKGSKARIGYAGMKDKRGVTTQFCTMYRTEPQQIVGDRRGGGGGNTKQKGGAIVQVGNFEYVSTEMRLGTLKGNRFDLALRNVQVSCDDEASSKELLRKAADAMKETGFINYFGMQRFGKYQDTHLTGISVLKGDFRKAIDIFMSPKPDDRPDAAKGRLDWQNRFKEGETAENEAAAAKRVKKCLNRFMTAEMSAMESLMRYPQNYQRAFTCIPKTLRMMFLHAVQSLVWNRAATERIKMNKTDVLAGDLVMLKDVEESSDIHVVSDDDITSKRFSIVDVVLPLVGVKSKFPANKMGNFMKELLKELGVSVESFKAVKDKDMALNGDYRKVLVRPSDFEYEIKEYFDPKQPLLKTDLMELSGEDIKIEPAVDCQSKKVAMIVGFTLPSSSYATVALRELMKKPTSSEYQKDLSLE